MTPDATGYLGPLTWVEYARNGRHDRGHWAEYDVLIKMQESASEPWRDSHVQITHYGRELPWAVPKTYEREGKEQDPDRLNKLDAVPHLANLIIDIDAPELEDARVEAIKVIDWLNEAGAPHIIYFSTRKGFHISIPWQALGVPQGGVAGLNWDVYSLMAQTIAEKLELKHLDHGLYKKNGFIRAANTIHPSTGLFKIWLTADELRLPHEDLIQLARNPRWETPPIEWDSIEPAMALQVLYQRSQIKADRKRSEVGAGRSLALPLDPAILQKLREGVTPCLAAIPRMVSGGVASNRNNVAFRAAMMMKYQGYTQEEAKQYLHDWLGPAYRDVGGDATLASVYQGPFSGGCQWMRDSGFATEADCAACPIGQKQARGRPEPSDSIEMLALPMLQPEDEVAVARKELIAAFDNLDPNSVNVVGASAGLGKSYAAIIKSIKIADNGGRVLIAVRDTKKAGGLGDEMAQNFRELGYTGKLVTLYGRNLDPESEENARVPLNCDNWEYAAKINKMGHGVSSTVCKTCPFRGSCGYYEQFDRAFEPGIYITSHAQLHHLTAGEHEAFKTRKLKPVGHGDDIVGFSELHVSELELIVIDEDILSTWLEEYYVGSWHLKQEVKQRRRRIANGKDMVGQPQWRYVNLDRNWIRVVKWLHTASASKGPVIHMLQRLAELEGAKLEHIMLAINPNTIVNPDPGYNEGHKPFTKRLFAALMSDLGRAEDGNPLVWANGKGLTIYGVIDVAFPEGVPVVVLDAYARPERYKAFLKAAGIVRPAHFKNYTVGTPPNVTYVLGAALTSGIVNSALNGHRWAIDKVTDIAEALKTLTSDGQRTIVVARRNLLTSDLLRGLLADSPHLILEDEDIGSLHFWRGRGINSASGERIAIIQDPNPPPEAVLIEASALHADEPRLDSSRMKSRYDVMWSPYAESPRGWTVPRWEYADERLNVIHRSLREDEVIQMALRGRSITTGAEILLFTDYVDARMPAKRVFNLFEFEVELSAVDIRQIVYSYLEGQDMLTPENAQLAFAGSLPSKHQRGLRRKLGEDYKHLEKGAAEPDIIEKEIQEWS